MHSRIFCPNCQNLDSDVIDSRGVEGKAIRRRRKCLKCDHRFTTYESYLGPPGGRAAFLPREMKSIRSRAEAQLKKLQRLIEHIDALSEEEVSE